MIVDPDFFDHWKTLLLIEALEGDQAAPLYVLRLWAHCQNRRQSCFDSLSDRALKALCRYPGHQTKLVSALAESGFVTRTDCGQLRVNGWDEYNAKLLANWENGKKGGRPPKKPNSPDPNTKENPTETQQKPKENPPRTQQEPNDNPMETQRKPIRVDRSRVDKNNSLSLSCAGPEFQKVWNRWRDHRLEKLKPLKQIEEETQLMRLADYPEDERIAIVKFSIERGAVNLIFDGGHKPEAGRGYRKGKSSFDVLEQI